jgi:ABC-type uncharacterized transport system involved in gliding motility auxiliary subunit
MKKTEIIIIILLSLTLIPALLLVSGLHGQIDLTDNGVYSIDDSTKELLKQFDQPLYITWWKSSDFDSPQIEVMDDLLKLYRHATGFELHTAVKSPDDDEKNRLRDLGLQENQIEISVNGVRKEVLIFSGLEISYLNHSVVIPFVADPFTLEFQIAEALDRLKEGGAKTLALYSDATIENPNGLYTIMTAELSKYFKVQTVSSKSPLEYIPDVMIVSGRVDYSVDQLYAIDRTIQAGSIVIFLVDGLKIDPQSNDYAVLQDEGTILNRWLGSYGVKIGQALISDDNGLSLNYVSGISQRYSNYNFWFKGNDSFDVLWAAPMTISVVDDITSEIFVESSDKSWLHEGETDIRPKESVDVPDFTGPYPVALELKGMFKPLFQASQNQDSREGTIFIFSSTLSFSDLMQSAGSFKNTMYLRNTIYRLLGKKDLYEIAENSLVLNKMKRETLSTGKGQFLVKSINLFIMPLFLIIVYSLCLFLRKKKRDE